MGCDRLSGLERLDAFDKVAIRDARHPGASSSSLCGPAALYQHSLGTGHSGEAIDQESQGLDANLSWTHI